MADPLLDLLGVGAPAAAPQATPGAGVDPLLALVQPSGSPAPAAPAATPSAPPANKFDLQTPQSRLAQNYTDTNGIGGLIRGAGSIGATLLRPFESAADNEQRRAGIDQGLTTAIGSDPNSSAYQGSKVISEIAGTSGIGGALAGALRMIPGAARLLPTLIPAIESGGMTANGAKGAYGMANRVAGGAVTGGASAGAINPEDAAPGAVIGGAAAPIVRALGATGQALTDIQRERLAKAVQDYGRKAPLNKTLQDSLDAGYVIPPATVKPTIINRALESVSGKQATQQLASVKNSEVTDGLVRKALTLPDDSALTVGTLEDLRKTAGKAYAEVASLSPQAASDLEALKVARNESQGWFKAYNRSASPIDLQKAKDARDTATQLETALESHAQQANRPDLVPALQDARKLIAKTYTVQRALNPATGTVDAKVLARMFQKGDPLSDGLDTAAKFGSAFPSVAKRPEQIGSPDAHNLKAMASMLSAMGGAASMGPVGAIAGAVPFLAPPAARSIMFSKAIQQGLVQQPPKSGTAAKLAALLQHQAALEQAARIAPATSAALSQ